MIVAYSYLRNLIDKARKMIYDGHMYGPSYELKLEIGSEHSIPHGVGSDGYRYYRGKFLGHLRQFVSHWHQDDFLVFDVGENGFAICTQNSRFIGNKSQITFEPKSIENTLELALEKLNPKYKWETFVSDTNEEIYPQLGKFKKE